MKNTSNKVDFFRYCLEDSSITFDFTDNEDKFFVNPIMEDDLYIDIFFAPVSATVAKLAFVEASSSFALAAIQANVRCKNRFDCGYSDHDISVIKKETEKAVQIFKANLQKN